MAQYVNQMILDRGIKPPKTGRVSLRVKHCPGLYLEVSTSRHMSWKCDATSHQDISEGTEAAACQLLAGC
jgi:hypothetical protein